MLRSALSTRYGLRAIVALCLLSGLAIFSVTVLTVLFTFPNWLNPCRLGTAEDYLYLHISGRAIVTGQSSNLYNLEDMKLVRQNVTRELASYCLNEDVRVEYLPIFIVPFTLFSLLPPLYGFFAWTLLSVTALAVAFYRLSLLVSGRTVIFLLFGAGSFFVFLGINYGQIHGFLLLAVTEFIVALRRDRGTAAGLWLALLLVKFQFLPLFLAFLVWQRNLPALRSFTMSTVILVAASLAIVGVEAVPQYLRFFTEAIVPVNAPTSGPRLMANWRGLVVNYLPVEGSVAIVLVALLSLATLAITLMSWRGRSWTRLRPEQQHVLLLGLSSGALLASYGSHLHSAVLVIAPGLLVAADLAKHSSANDTVLAWILDLTLLAPSIVFAFGAFALRNSAWLAASHVTTLGLLTAWLWCATSSLWFREDSLRSLPR